MGNNFHQGEGRFPERDKPGGLVLSVCGGGGGARNFEIGSRRGRISGDRLPGWRWGVHHPLQYPGHKGADFGIFSKRLLILN